MLNPGQIPFVMYVAVLGDHYGQTESTYYVHIGQRNRIAQVQELSFCVFLEDIAAWVEKGRSFAIVTEASSHPSVCG